MSTFWDAGTCRFYCCGFGVPSIYTLMVLELRGGMMTVKRAACRLRARVCAAFISYMNVMVACCGFKVRHMRYHSALYC